MKLIDMTGKKFGALTVIERAEKPPGSSSTSAFWLCECECGNKKIISGNSLRAGRTKSCGCLTYKNRAKEDLTGQKFGHLTVIKRVEKPEHIKNAEPYYLCKCECGNEKIILGRSLRIGKTKSCGCHLDQVTDLTGRTFGKLTVISRDYEHKKGNGAYWFCKCECGNIVSVRLGNLYAGNVQSCGCLTSVGENEIEKILISNNIPYKKQYSFSDLLGPRGGLLRFDFAIFDNHNHLVKLIEFQGEQHYDKNSAFFDKSVFETDKKKKEYCEKKQIPLLQLGYWHRNSLTLNKLISEEELHRMEV